MGNWLLSFALSLLFMMIYWMSVIIVNGISNACKDALKYLQSHNSSSEGPFIAVIILLLGFTCFTLTVFIHSFL